MINWSIRSMCVDQFIHATVAVDAVALLFFFRHNCSVKSLIFYAVWEQSVGEVSKDNYSTVKVD